MDGGLRQLFRKHLPHFHICAIETGGTGRGIPDFEYCFNGQTGWVECKGVSGWAVPLRPEQVAWLTRRARAGGRAFIAVRRRAPASRRRGAAADELYLIPGARAAELKAGGLRALAPEIYFNEWAGGPSKWDWDAIARLLTSP